MASNSGFAVQIVDYQSGKVRFQLDALMPILQKVGDNPLAVVSVNGPMRTGKSYLLGHFMRFFNAKGNGKWSQENLTKEFEWKSSSERQTTGILIWSEPFLLTKDDRQIAVLLMDTQGSFDEQTDYNINYMLFAFSCLLSSVLIYNVKHQISEDVLQFLQMFLGFARMPMEEGVDEPFASLVLLIRDWQNPKNYSYGYHDKNQPEEKNFLKDKLEVRNHMAEDVKEVHEQVIACFQSVACCLLPHPGNQLATEDKTDNLDKSFLTAIEDLVPRVCAAENVILKTIGGQIITGRWMGELVKGWDKLFDKVPIDDIKSLANMAAEKQNQIALTKAMNAYKKQMDVVKSSNDSNEQELEKLHNSAKAEAISIFKMEKRMRYPNIEEQFLKNLKAQIKTAYGFYKEINGMLIAIKTLKVECVDGRERLRQEMTESMKLAEMRMEKKSKLEKKEIENLEKKKRHKMEAKLKQGWEEIKQQFIDKINAANAEYQSQKQTNEVNQKKIQTLETDDQEHKKLFETLNKKVKQLENNNSWCSLS